MVDRPPREGPLGRVILTGAFTLAMVGLYVGTRHRLPPEAPPFGEVMSYHETHGDAVPARSNRELLARPWGSEDARWRAPEVRTTTPVTTQHAAAKAAAIAQREQHRAYAGAPPTIPHPIGQKSAVECRACHERGTHIGATLAPAMGHELYTSCTQCHVPEVSPVPGEDRGLVVASTFEPLRGAAWPLRWSIAPPQIPHGLHMRERCVACHGPGGRAGLQTSHPERQSCTQCHTAAARVEALPPNPAPAEQLARGQLEQPAHTTEPRAP